MKKILFYVNLKNTLMLMVSITIIMQTFAMASYTQEDIDAAYQQGKSDARKNKNKNNKRSRNQYKEDDDNDNSQNTRNNNRGKRMAVGGLVGAGIGGLAGRNLGGAALGGGLGALLGAVL